MNEDSQGKTSPESKSWLDKISSALGGSEPKNRSDLLELLRESLDRELLDVDTFRMIEGAMQVSEMQVRDAMIPRGQMVCVSSTTTLEDLLPQVVASGHSRFPIIKDDKDEVSGILLAKDLLAYVIDPTQTFDLNSLARDPVFIPESKRLNVLLKEFRDSRNHMAIVVDEYGGVAGLITIEDVLEEIVGEIDDEHDDEEPPPIRKNKNGNYTIDALTPIDEFNRHFEATLNEESFDTIGGLITGELGRLPETGETIEVNNFKFEVLKTDDRRLTLLGLGQSEAES